MAVQLATRTTSVRKAQYAYATLADLIADATRLGALVDGGAVLAARLAGGWSEGDGGRSEVAIERTTGAESWVTANGVTFSAGGAIKISDSCKLTWPDRDINAIVLGAKTVEQSSQSDSQTFCDNLFERSGSILANGYTLYLPAGTYYHKSFALSFSNIDYGGVRGDGIGRTKLYAGAQASYGPDDVPNGAAFQFDGGKYNVIRDVSYYGEWYRQRGFRMRSGNSLIVDCYAEKTCGRAFAISGPDDAEWDNIDTDYSNQEIRNCVAYKSLGTAFSTFAVPYAAIRNCRVAVCWAEAATLDACDYGIIETCFGEDVCRQDDGAGEPIAGLYDGVAGNGGIAGFSPGLSSNIRIVDNVLVGIGQDDASSTSRTKPFVRSRSNRNPNNEGGLIAGNTFKDGFVGVHIEKHFQPENSTPPSTKVFGVSRYFTVTGNAFYNVKTNSGQGHVRIDEECVGCTVVGNTSDNAFKVFSGTSIDATHDGSNWSTSEVIDDTMASLPNNTVVMQRGCGVWLGGANVINSVTFESPPVLSGTAPSVRWNETDQATDEKNWRIAATAGELRVLTANDANDTTATAISVQRTGTTVDEVQVDATTIDLNGAVDCSSTVNAATEYRVAGTKVLGAQQAHIADSTDATVTEYRDKINAIIAVLEAHGLKATS